MPAPAQTPLAAPILPIPQNHGQDARATSMPDEPFLPFTRPTIDEETIAGVAEVLRSGWITSGPQVKAFEGKLTEYFGRPARVFNSGTCTMEIALRLAGIGIRAYGDVVQVRRRSRSRCNRERNVGKLGRSESDRLCGDA